MYASSAADLEAAIEQLQLMSHKQYVQRVATFLERKAEWVLVFRSNLLTRGHNTNNFAEASIRVLKDVVLHRRKAYNAVALVDLVVDIWESYFRLRLLDHAYNRVPAHQLLYHKLLERMPSGAAEKIRPLGDSTYEVPSSTLDVDTAYQVCMDLGTCTCQSGQQGAFCKHQALVHHCYGGNFPNAPVVTAKDRHQLGLLALGDRCRDQAFFQGFRDSSPQETSTSTGPAQPVDAEPEPQQPMDTEPQLEAQGSAGSTHQREVWLRFMQAHTFIRMHLLTAPVTAAQCSRQLTAAQCSVQLCGAEPKDVDSIPAAVADFLIEVKSKNVCVTRFWRML